MLRQVRRAVELTPPERDRYVDLLRALAITMVVLGHWLVVAVTYSDDDGLDGFSALATVPWSRPLTWLFQVMPLFFLVGGYVNGASFDGRRRDGGDAAGWLLRRAGRLLGPTTVFVVTVAGCALVARLLGADPELVGTAGWLVAIPLWFLTAYLVVVVLTPLLYPLHRRAGWLVVAVLVGGVAVADTARFAFDVEQVAYANYLLVWLAVHQVGFLWRDGRLPGRTGAAVLTVAALLVLLWCTVVGPYPVSMVTVPGEEVQNTAPPTLALLSLAATQTGLALLLRPPVERWLRGRRPWTLVVAVNLVALTVFLWHMAAVVVAAGVLYPPGLLPQPAVGSAEWLLWRVPWLGCLLVVLLVLVLVFSPAERGLPLPRGAEDTAEGRGAGGVRLRGVRPAVTCVGLGLAVAGLLGITVSGPEDHGPFGLPGAALLAYLVGIGALWLLPRGRAD
ncbi:acyltransferase family protein [Streptomyces alkaliterrae]|uniref:acyltransferase family protein n=1 Tax=Streptomyces alkaliterrae TaxID=2213162 RepID=UPI002B208325|nr:acyltransferase [Streptomyces alkaliterrae]